MPLKPVHTLQKYHLRYCKENDRKPVLGVWDTFDNNDARAVQCFLKYLKVEFDQKWHKPCCQHEQGKWMLPFYKHEGVCLQGDTIEIMKQVQQTFALQSLKADHAVEQLLREVYSQIVAKNFDHGKEVAS